MPKYSIIVPVYNASKFLSECIESILTQEYGVFELILIDDCSIDESLQICRDFELRDSRIKVFHQERNLGVSAARNLGLDKAQGKYVLFVDSDDFVDRSYLKTIEVVLSDESQLVAFGNYDYVIKTNGEKETQNSSMNIELIGGDCKKETWHDFIIDSFFASPCNKVFSLEIIRRNNLRFDTQCVCFEDYIFNVNYCKHISSFQVISTPLYYYRSFESVNHVSKRKWGKLFEISKKVANATNEFIYSKSRDKNLFDIRRYTYQAYVTEMKACLFRGDTEIEAMLDRLCNDKEFLLAIKSIKAKGITLFVLSMCLSLRLKKTSKKIIKSRLLNNGR